MPAGNAVAVGHAGPARTVPTRSTTSMAGTKLSPALLRWRVRTPEAERLCPRPGALPRRHSIQQSPERREASGGETESKTVRVLAPCSCAKLLAKLAACCTWRGDVSMLEASASPWTIVWCGMHGFVSATNTLPDLLRSLASPIAHRLVGHQCTNSAPQSIRYTRPRGPPLQSGVKREWYLPRHAP